MGISYKNGSGYPDPTAYMAVHNVEAEEKILHIQYPTGYMDLKMDAFFPCTVDRARKIFRLICPYCSREEKDRLLRFLKEKDRRYQSQIQTFQSQERRSSDPKEKAVLLQRIRESERFRQRLRRNMEIFLEKEGKL